MQETILKNGRQFHSHPVCSFALSVLFLLGCAVPICLKVPKRENFSLEFIALSEPIWVYELGTGEKIEFFID
jgi:hypothetical protein